VSRIAKNFVNNAFAAARSCPIWLKPNAIAAHLFVCASARAASLQSWPDGFPDKRAA
jgi:hypothetical protein